MQEKSLFFKKKCIKIWSIRKKVVPLHAFLRECTLCTCAKAR